MTTTTEATFTLGARASITHVVGPQDAASAWGNELDVLATPVLLWLSEITSMKAIQRQVPTGFMTVGSAHDSTHQAPTPTGETVTVYAELVEVRGRLLTFEVKAHDERTAILHGRHTRAVVDADAFARKICDMKTAHPTSHDQ